MPCPAYLGRNHLSCNKHYSIAAIARIPSPETISHVPVTSDPPLRQGLTPSQDPEQSDDAPPRGTTDSVTFSAGFPPVPSKLVKRIQDGEYVDLAELTIDCLSMPGLFDASRSTQIRKRPITSITEWTQCFNNYTSIRGRTQPEKIHDFLGYEHLIIEAHLEYFGDAWAVYDRRFRQIAASRGDIIWARRDMDLWHTVFAGCQRRPYCKHCFGPTHSEDQCCAALVPLPRERTTVTPQPPKPRICREWNFSQCSFLGCRYIHACLTCYTDPDSTGSNHKWIQCHRNPNRRRGPSAPPPRGVPPLMGMSQPPY